jgi:branched-chain amino acid transport system ATP-binding protein
LASSITIENVDASYGAVRVLEQVTIDVKPGETVTLLGTNGNGKSTLMKCIMGMVRPSAGRIMAAIDGVQHDLTSLTTEQIVDLGIALVPEGRRLFPKLTVEENLALGRALMLAPKILLVDEPSVGLAPILVSRTIDKIKELKDRLNLTVLMAEQNFTQALRIADRGYVIVHGKIAFAGNSVDELNNNDLIRKFYLGL